MNYSKVGVLYKFKQIKACVNCKQLIGFEVTFCPKCGHSESKVQNDTYRLKSKKAIIRLSVYYLVSVLIIGTYAFVLDYNFKTSVKIDIIMSVFTLSLAVTNLPELLPLYKLNKLKLKPLLFSLIIPIPFAFFVDFSASIINRFFDLDNLEYIDLYAFTDYPVFYAILFIALVPALFEEMAFRGFMMTDLLKFTNEKTVIMVTTILFAFVHFSPISLFWLLPMGWVLAKMRLKYKLIWYGIIFHFLHNMTITLIEIYGLSLYPI